MRKLWPLLAVALGAIALAAVVGVVRRESLASTPGEVVERFLDHVVRDRYEKAAPFLAERTGRAEPAVLKEWKQKVETGLGKVRRVRGQTDWISGENAEATGVLVADKRERRLRFSLEREAGRWRIARLDEFWAKSDPRTEPDPRSVRIRESWRDRPRPRHRGSR